VPARGRWLCEIKQDGYRLQAHLNHGAWTLYSRRGHNWSDRFAPISRALEDFPADSAVIDGEAVVLGENGIADFRMLQADLNAGRSDRLVYFAFDLLYVDGFDLRGCALEARKELLAKRLGESTPRIRYSDHVEAEPADVFKNACEMGLEGIVCKQRGSRYQSGESDLWVKVKCKQSDTFPIVAFVEKLGAHPRRIASLYLGRWEDGRLLYAGKAETGFKHEMLYELRERLDPHIRATSPLNVPLKKPKATWVEPVVESEIEYSNVTAGNILRMPVFKGIRDDLSVATAASRTRSGKSGIGVSKTNILQLLPDAVVPSKEELAAYWRRVGKRALDYLGRRPLKFVRHSHGTTYYHMGRLPPVPESVHTLTIKKREGGEGTRLWVDDVDGLLGLVSMGIVELHPWNATIDDIEHADIIVVDLDPGTGVDYAFVVESALALRQLLQTEGYSPWPKLSGGKGIHVMIPLDQRITHDAAHRLAKRLVQQLASRDPKRYTLSAASRERRGRLFLDYLRNGRGTTAVGTYSPRARPGFPIAYPVSWTQVETGIRPNAFTMQRELDAQLTRRASGSPR
jgi:bifunctional non-homologous end joining protein LigD